LKLWGHLRALLRLGPAPRPEESQVARRAAGGLAADQVVVVTEGPMPLAEMYADLLRGQGVPAMLRSSGAGRGALGGVPGAAEVLVPAEALGRARDILGIDDTGQRAGDERKDGESR
jgi:hypothetical protein